MGVKRQQIVMKIATRRWPGWV